MTLGFALLSFVLLLGQVLLPSRLAFLPLIAAASHLPHTVSVIDVGGFNFTICRALLCVGLLRAANQGTWCYSIRHPVDFLMLLWASWTLLSTFGHAWGEYNPLTARMAMIFDAAGTYLYARAYVRDGEAFQRLAKCLVYVLIPLAVLLLVEKFTRHNLYTFVGARIDEAWVRAGRVRAAGPFAVAILAGTAGATCLLFACALFKTQARLAWLGLVTSITIVVCSASSGPIMTLLAGTVALVAWRWRTSLRAIQIAVVLAIAALAIVMKAPVWYLIARIDLMGGSTGYHRAELITQAIKHFDRWWFMGTDYTRDWMPYGITWSDAHVDITNHYIKMGVVGGLPMLLLFVAILLKSFRILGRAVAARRAELAEDEFAVWCMGAALFAHALTFLSVSYFDQTYVFYWTLVGAVASLYVAPAPQSSFQFESAEAHTCSN